MGVRFLHLAGHTDLGHHRLVREVLELWIHGRIYYPGMGTHPPRVWRNLDVVPGGPFRRALAP